MNKFSFFRSQRRPNHCTIVVSVLVLSLTGWSPVAWAANPLELIPADALACWNSAPFPDVTADNGASPLSTLVDVGTRLVGAKLDRSTQITLRLAEALSQSVRFPLAIAFLDVQARAATLDPQGRKLERFQVVGVIQCGAEAENLRKIIQKIINEQTDQANATLGAKEAEGFRYQELRDKRKEDLGAIAWGQIGDCFVITLGDGLWARVAQIAAKKSGSLAADAWVKKAREPGDHPTIEIFAAFRDLAQRLDPLMDNRISQFLRAWAVEDTRRVWWSLGFEGRAMFVRAAFEDAGGTTHERCFADPHFADTALLRVVPAKARFAVFEFQAGLVLQRSIAGYYAFCNAKNCQTADQRWQKILAETHIDPQRDILGLLGDRLIFHNDPPHPLHLPLAFTTLIEIRGDPRAFRNALDRLLSAWESAAEDQDATPETAELIQLRHDGDGVWYIELGPIAGIAWTTTERFLVASWSPQALRAYLSEIGAAVGKRQ